MPAGITYLHLRNMLPELSPSERKKVLTQMIDNGIKLTPEEEKYLSDKEMRIYVSKELEKAGGLTPYELQFTDDTEKDIYIMTDKRLELLFPIINSLDSSWRKKILTQAVFQNKGVTDELFSSLSDEDKRFYANLTIVNTAYLSALQLKYLSSKNQKQIIYQIIERGEDFSVEQLQSLTKENQKFYVELNKKRRNVQESIRKLIRETINEVVSEPGTIFGPYHDEVVLPKSKTNPQYFSIALNRANKICSEPTASEQGLNCPVNYEIEKTKHSAERQFRHINTTIEDEQIKNVVNKGIDRLVKLLLSNALRMGDKVHLKDKNSDLNVIVGIELERIDGDESIIRFPIVTVMNKKNFITGYDTKGPVMV